MNDEEMVIRCLNCGTKNRIPKTRLHDRPLCGKCGNPLDEIIIRCLSCGAKNRIPENRLNEKPRCGKCGVPLVFAKDHGRPFDVNDFNFEREVLTVAVPVIVDCWAPWCAPCLRMSPILDELAAKYAGGIFIAKLNVDESPQTASRYNIKSIPTLLFFNGGELVDSLVGVLPRAAIEQHIAAMMKRN
jgi:thioredoxin 2